MKFEKKLTVALIAASLAFAGTAMADHHEKQNEPAGAEVQVQTDDSELEADSQLKVDEPAGAESQVQTDDTQLEADSQIKVDEPAGAESGKPEEKFAKKAAQAGMAEVKIGELAAQKAESSSVKQFGDKLARDHQQANDKLKQLCERKGITVSEELNKKHTEKLEELGKLSGQEFDQAFLKHAIEDHQKEIREFEKQANEGEDPAIRSFASETLPTLREHLRIAQTLQENRNASIPELREPAGAEPSQDQEQNQDQPAEPPQLESQPDDASSQDADSSTQTDVNP